MSWSWSILDSNLVTEMHPDIFIIMCNVCREINCSVQLWVCWVNIIYCILILDCKRQSRTGNAFAKIWTLLALGSRMITMGPWSHLTNRGTVKLIVILSYSTIPFLDGLVHSLHTQTLRQTHSFTSVTLSVIGLISKRDVSGNTATHYPWVKQSSHQVSSQ